MSSTAANPSRSTSPRSTMATGIGANLRILLRSLPLLWKIAPIAMSGLTLSLLVQGGLPALSIWINKQVVDGVATALQQDSIINPAQWIVLVAGWVAALLLSSLLEAFNPMIWGNLREQVAAQFTTKLMVKAGSLPDLTHFEDPSFYDELQVLQKKIDNAPIDLVSFLIQIGRQLFTVATLSFLLLPVSWWIPPLLILTTLPETTVRFQQRKRLWELSTEKSIEVRRMNYASSLMLTDSYAKEVRLFNLGPFILDRYNTAFESHHQSMRRLRRETTLKTLGFTIVSVMGNGFAFFWVTQQAFRGQISPGSILLFVQSLVLIEQNLRRLVGEMGFLYDALIFMGRFFAFLDTEPMMKVDPHLRSDQISSISNPSSTGSLSIIFDQVSFQYPDGRWALQNLSFCLKSGETVALVGENGAGKTTLVKLLARLYDPTSGCITINGQDLRDLDLIQWREQIAVVFQDFGRYSFTIAENVVLNAQNIDPQQLEYAIQRAGLGQMIDRLPQGYEAMLGKPFNGTELSGGEWQKLAIARAFLRQDQARLLILDEPTASLDPRSEYEVYQQFADLSQTKTTLLVTHRLASTRMADRILVLKAGQLIEHGSHQELLDLEGEYASLWTMQAQYYGY